MNRKKLLSLILAVAVGMSSFAVFAENVETTADDAAKEIVVPAEEIVAMSDDGNDSFIDYADMSNWAYWNQGENKSADLFFICPTVDMGKAGNLVADIENEKYRSSFVGATNMELGVYDGVASVYAPYYRQATFPVYSLSEEEREVYLDIAYQDIKNAFIYYAEHTDEKRPLILAGFSQGADLLIRLMKDLFDEPEYQSRLAMAYAIGWKLTEAEVAKFPHLKPAMGETDTGVIITFNSEAEGVTSSIIVGEDEKTYSINPLNWKTTSEVADKSLNKGACFTDYSGNIKEETVNLTGAYIDEKRGTLKVLDVAKEDYSSSMFDEGVYHLYDYQFFFRNLQENVEKRLAAFNEKHTDRISVFYNDEVITFDVEPVIENGRTLVPLRAIFEVMGCAVGYSKADGKQMITARRAKDNLMLTIGDDSMYFNGREITLDVPAKIKDGRTLVPLRAISEAFECEVYWHSETKSIDIYSPTECFSVNAQKLTETITDQNGNAIIEAVAYYPALKNPMEIPVLDTINEDYKLSAEAFIEEAKAKKEDALILQAEMGEDFAPFTYEMTFEQNYNATGYLSLTNHKYIYTGGAHPTSVMESKSFCTSDNREMSLSDVIAEESLEVSLSDDVINLFVEKLKELEAGEEYNYDFIQEYIGYLQFYLTKDSVVLYFNQGDIAPYAVGVISVEIPYEQGY